MTDPAHSHWRLAHSFNAVRLATGFLTRLPVGTHLDYSPDKMHSALRWFPTVGWLLAGVLAIIWLVASSVLGTGPGVCLLLIGSVLLTGALHEDGLADCFDGFYGGFETRRKLDIMKDSRIGTYGTCALVLALVTKFSLLWSLSEQGWLISALFVGYPLSRALAITHAQDLTYVSAPGKSKSDPLARPLSFPMLMQLLGTGVFGLVVLWANGNVGISGVLVVGAACWASRWWLKRWMHKHIHGFTGDCLGAAQQLQELWIYALLLALANTGMLV